VARSVNRMIAQLRKTEFFRGFSSMKQLPLIRAMITALALLVARPTAAAGEVTPPRIAHPWIIRGETHAGGTPLFNLVFTPPNQNSVSALALTLGRNFTEAFSVEATLGAGIPGDTYSPGVESMIVGRGALVLGQGRQHALTIAAGPMFIAGGAYGPVAFAHTEVGYELRIELLTFVFAVGPDLTLTNSRAQSIPGCGGGGIFGPALPACVRPFAQGDLFAHFRVGAGFTF
jgi:hypothetical protein